MKELWYTLLCYRFHKEREKNVGCVTLIGMPGSGKSTVGVLAAKALGYGFLDTDLVIQQREGALLQEILDRGREGERCIRAGEDRTGADRAFHAAIVRAAHNEFMLRLLPMIHQAVETAVAAGEHPDRLAEDTLRDHALLLEFIARRDGEGARHAMAIHMRHSMAVMGLETAEQSRPGREH